jgi:hypothetical protein
MKRRFKGLLCAYCSTRVAVTGDHIFARKFLLESARADLPQAPACDRCNNEKAKLENYLMAVLPFGGRHADAIENLASMVPKRLQKNIKLYKQLAEGFSGNRLPLEGEKLEKLMGLIARGLIWHHWNVYLNDETHAIHVATISADGMARYQKTVFGLTTPNRLNESIGGDAFACEGMQAVDDPALTVWRFSIYGGLMVGDASASDRLGCDFVVITGPKSLIQKIDELIV